MEQHSCIINSQSYTNPIVYGDFPDPSILKDGDDYYLVHSVCGEHLRLLPMWHSTDLVNWKLLYHVFEGAVRSDNGETLLTAWAPELIKHGDRYYIYNYSPDYGVWVSFCEDITVGKWSNPLLMDGIKDIDPGHVTDEKGNRYLCMAKNMLYPLSEDGLSVIGAPRKICEDWQIPDDIDVEGRYPESPKFYKRDDYYYLVIADGGTMGPPTSHFVISYRSKNLMGDYELSPYNPIVHTDNKSQKWWSTGHGTLVDGPNSKTYIIYHGIENAHRYVGRQTLMMPVTWTSDGWFVVEGVDSEAQSVPAFAPQNKNEKLSVNPSDRQFPLLYNFDDSSVMKRLSFVQGHIRYNCSPTDVMNTPALTFMHQSNFYEYCVVINPCEAGAGFALGYRFDKNIHCYISLMDGKLTLIKHLQEIHSEKISSQDKITLKIRNNHGTVSFWIKSESSEQFKKLIHTVDISDWNPNNTDGFSYVNPCLWSHGRGAICIDEIIYKNL